MFGRFLLGSQLSNDPRREEVEQCKGRIQEGVGDVSVPPETLDIAGGIRLFSAVQNCLLD